MPKGLLPPKSLTKWIKIPQQDSSSSLTFCSYFIGTSLDHSWDKFFQSQEGVKVRMLWIGLTLSYSCGKVCLVFLGRGHVRDGKGEGMLVRRPGADLRSRHAKCAEEGWIRDGSSLRVWPIFSFWQLHMHQQSSFSPLLGFLTGEGWQAELVIS